MYGAFNSFNSEMMLASRTLRAQICLCMSQDSLVNRWILALSNTSGREVALVPVATSDDFGGVGVMLGSGTSGWRCAGSGRWILGLSDTTGWEMVLAVTSDDFGRAGVGVSETSDWRCAGSGRWILGLSGTSGWEIALVVTPDHFGRAGIGAKVFGCGTSDWRCTTALGWGVDAERRGFSC